MTINHQECYNDILNKEIRLATTLPGADRDVLIFEKVNLLDKIISNVPKEEVKFKQIIGSALLFLNEENLQQYGLISGFTTHSPQLCKYFSNEKENSDILSYHYSKLLDVQEKIISSVANTTISHGKSRFCLNNVIKKLEKLLPETQEERAFATKVKLALAKACYLRARIIRPKGDSITSKKKNLLQDALRHINDASSQAHVDQIAQTSLLKALIYLEIAHDAEPPQDFTAVLQAPIEGKSTLERSRDIVRIILALADQGIQDGKQQVLLRAIIDESDENCAKHTDKARASYHLKEWNLLADTLDKAIAKLDTCPFHHPDWDIIVRLAKGSRNQINQQTWRNLCLSLWNKCKRREWATSHGCHLRWYWSRQRDLYDLAFFAAGDDYALKAKIADSLKARPSLHLTALEFMNDEEIQKRIDAEMHGLLDHYMPDFSSGAANAAPEDESWPDLPEGWLSVHFYLSNGFVSGSPYKGFALIYDGKEWQEEQFKYDGILNAYVNWQNSYSRFTGGQSDPSSLPRLQAKAGEDLERLCKILGEEMPFLVNPEKIPVQHPVVLIPHGFLHRLPLHMTMNQQCIPRSLANPFTYLPAWWIAGNKNVPGNVNGTTALVGLNDHESRDILPLLETLPGVDTTRNATEQDLLNITSPPEKLAIIAHGRSHAINPFFSQLCLGRGVSLKEILSRKSLNIHGTKIVLGACETDLVSSFSGDRDVIDEHISISSVLLNRGAGEVSGALWQIYHRDAYNYVNMVLTGKGKTLMDILWNWQQQRVAQYLADSTPQRRDILLGTAPFRVLGLGTR